MHGRLTRAGGCVMLGGMEAQEDGDEIDCTRMGIGGKAIPSNMTKVTHLRSDALFVLLVEKDAAFMRLAEDRFYNRFPCIILTAKGQPDVASRLFLNKLKTELKIPILAVVDSDPYGLKILSVYMQVGAACYACRPDVAAPAPHSLRHSVFVVDADVGPGETSLEPQCWPCPGVRVKGGRNCVGDPVARDEFTAA